MNWSPDGFPRLDYGRAGKKLMGGEADVSVLHLSTMCVTWGLLRCREQIQAADPVRKFALWSPD